MRYQVCDAAHKTRCEIQLNPGAPAARRDSQLSVPDWRVTHSTPRRIWRNGIQKRRRPPAWRPPWFPLSLKESHLEGEAVRGRSRWDSASLLPVAPLLTAADFFPSRRE